MTSCTVQSGTVCTQVGPSSYARTPIFITSCTDGIGNPTVSVKYGAPVYSATPCGSSGGASQGDSTLAPASVSPPPPANVGPGQSFTISQLTGGAPVGYDPACAMYYGFVPVSYGSFIVDVCAWAPTINAATWVSTPPPRNTLTDGTWYSFPATRKWVVVGDGIFRTTTFGKAWEKRQDWATTPHRCFYVSSSLLVGLSQTPTGVNFLASQDDGATWNVFYTATNYFIQLGALRGSGATVPANYQPDSPYSYAQNLGWFGQNAMYPSTYGQVVEGTTGGGVYGLLSYGLRPDISPTIFGWSGTAPGAATGSPQSILFTSETNPPSLWGQQVDPPIVAGESSPFTLASSEWALGLRGRW